jgi:cobalt-zinc-cadmium resistance protein CzcA
MAHREVRRSVLPLVLLATVVLAAPRYAHGSQRPFAIVIVGGLIAALVMSIFLLPTLYVWIASDRDVLPAADGKFEEGEHVD